MTNRFLFLIISLSLLLTLGGCGGSLEEDIKFTVLSYNGNFTGVYSADSQTLNTFTGSAIGNSVYYYEIELAIINQIEIEATPQPDSSGNIDSTSLAIKVYSYNTLVDSIEDSKQSSTDTVQKISLTYRVGDTSIIE